MHILLSLLGTIVTILWLLHRLAEMGIDLGGLNPWLWRRRRRWRKQYHANPVYQIKQPMEALALLLTAVAKADGDMSAEEKQAVLTIFKEKFHLSTQESSNLLSASVHLLGQGDDVRDNPKAVLAGSIDQFSSEQKQSAIELLRQLAQSEPQIEYARRLQDILQPQQDKPGNW